MDEYIPVIGLEMHCEIKSNSKVFSNSKNDFSDMPNSNVNQIDLAFPGILPILNKECVNKSIMMALILNCKLSKKMYFDRKNYYYPDLPKGYQITQSSFPIGTDGYLEISINNSIKKVSILDIHLEEDSASLDHLYDTTLIDYNRAGVPLLETVTAPCLHSKEEAIAFLESMCSIFRYTNISDADTKKGQIRCDVNVSIMHKNDKEFGTKVEVKNINSFVNVGLTIDYEINRQIELIKNNKKDEIVQETRRFDEQTGKTISMRSKADAIDYRYFIEPNIPPYIITNDLVEEIKFKIPILAYERKNKYINKYKLNEYDSNILIKDKNISDYFEECIKIGIDPKQATNWITGNIMSELYKRQININDFYFNPNMLKDIINSINNGKISSKQAKEIFLKSIEDNIEPKIIIEQTNIIQESDENILLEIINNILNNNYDNIQQYKNGKDNIFQFFVGQVMKETKGKANPEITRDLIKKELDKR